MHGERLRAGWLLLNNRPKTTTQAPHLARPLVVDEQVGPLEVAVQHRRRARMQEQHPLGRAQRLRMRGRAGLQVRL